MSRSHVISISSFTSYFAEERIIKRAENALASGHVTQLQFDSDLGCIRGKVQASMKNKFYKVEIYLRGTEIDSTCCDCPRGLSVCHHMASLALFAHYNLSVTDTACNWLRKKGVTEVLTAEQSFPSTSKDYSPLAEHISDEAVSSLFNELSLCAPTNAHWIMSPEPGVTENVIPDIEQLVFSLEYNTSKDKLQYLKNILKVSQTEIEYISSITIGQYENPMWLIVKKHRLTASNFGRVIKAYKLSRFPPSLFKSLAGAYNLDGVKQIQYGRSNESVAIEKFEEESNLKVKKTGIHLHQCGYLGASPDGMLEEESSIIEVKCPYQYRNDCFIDVLQKDKKYIVCYDQETNKFVVNINHDYYHQIQGQLHIMNKDKCYLILYSQIDMIVLEVIKDIEWSSNIQLLNDFYLNKYIPWIIS